MQLSSVASMQGRKIAGAAQRRNKQGLLIQGSIQPTPPDLLRTRWEEAMLRSAEEDWEVRWHHWPAPSDTLMRRIEELRSRYASSDYNERR